VKIAELLSQQKLWAMRNQFGKLKELEARIHEDHATRASLVHEMMAHYDSH
jgi:hypothetical protein